MKLKNRKLIFLFRIEAIKNAIFSNRFETRTFHKNGSHKEVIKFNKKEILDTKMASLSDVKKYLTTLID